MYHPNEESSEEEGLADDDFKPYIHMCCVIDSNTGIFSTFIMYIKDVYLKK